MVLEDVLHEEEQWRLLLATLRALLAQSRGQEAAALAQCCIQLLAKWAPRPPPPSLPACPAVSRVMTV